MTSAVAIAIASSATAAILDSRGPRSRLCDRRPVCAQRRVVLADREARVVLVDEGLAVEAERFGIRAKEPADVRRRRKDVEVLVLERPQVLRANLRALLELRKVEILAEAGLTEA